MIEGKDIAWHYDACIEMWNEIAEANDVDVEWFSAKKSTKLVKKYQPDTYCFSCEVYYWGGCIGCPLNPKEIENNTSFSAPCEQEGVYMMVRTSNPSERKTYAIEIAQLFIDQYPKG